ncbi:hypothetical protein K505DRAFT_74350 [Melanomma pulvis-pyrius CBS 109.77]|uniref:Uncharacterized protein n=1 Tax=Melanomma pulvis-pyrius CBS 109.77 TaxID=1314802 RepID=A0A6A6X3J3_9PLEO|nr:hypothetical protein K505DRAFT_74350 [Melanomma pulvis-pyrius CBS 109.77]
MYSSVSGLDLISDPLKLQYALLTTLFMRWFSCVPIHCPSRTIYTLPNPPPIFITKVLVWVMNCGILVVAVLPDLEGQNFQLGLVYGVVLIRQMVWRGRMESFSESCQTTVLIAKREDAPKLDENSETSQAERGLGCAPYFMISSLASLDNVQPNLSRGILSLLLTW